MTVIDILTSIQLSSTLIIAAYILVSCAAVISIASFFMLALNIKIKKSVIKKSAIKLLKVGILLWILLLVSVFYNIFIKTINGNIDSFNERQPLQIKPGKVLLFNDKALSSQDYTVNALSDNTNITIELWDYGSQDGDVIQVYADNTAYTDPFSIKNTSVKISVPANSNIKIKGINSGSQDGISYAIYFTDIKQSYANCVSVGGYNKYTIKTN